MKWQPSELEIRDIFGGDVDISGKRLIVGAHATGKDVNPGQQYATGAVYILDIETQQYWRLLPPDPQRQGQFGKSVAISGDFATIGAIGVEGFMGAVYLYKFKDGEWDLLETFSPTTQTPKQELGKAVDITDDFMAAGSPGEDGEKGAVTFSLYGESTEDEIGDLAAKLFSLANHVVRWKLTGTSPKAAAARDEHKMRAKRVARKIAEAILT